MVGDGKGQHGQNLQSPLELAVSKRDENVLEMVRNSLAQGSALLAYQPICPAENLKTPTFYEGLIRVLDETGRIIPARDFMGQIEDTDLGRQVDCKSLELGLNTLIHNPDLRLSINMSARSIGYTQWTDLLNAALDRHPTVGERLILEITESSVMLVPEIAINFMTNLQRRGVSFALDDFGAGFTAFRYFKEFYFDIIKIDGQFVRNVAQDSDNQVLIRALISIAEQFDMPTVAEAVETAEDAAMLCALGIDCLQGYYLGAPTIRPPWDQSGANTRQVAG